MGKIDFILFQRANNFSTLCVILTLLLISMPTTSTDILDNTCTFRVDGRLFVLTFLNLKDQSQGYYLYHKNN